MKISDCGVSTSVHNKPLHTCLTDEDKDYVLATYREVVREFIGYGRLPSAVIFEGR